MAVGLDWRVVAYKLTLSLGLLSGFVTLHISNSEMTFLVLFSCLLLNVSCERLHVDIIIALC